MIQIRVQTRKGHPREEIRDGLSTGIPITFYKDYLL
jgi:hypothetical protein